MTNNERLRALRRAMRHLRNTKQGFNLSGTEWKAAWEDLVKLEKDLEPNPVPALGPVCRGGKTILQHDLTHPTGGIPLYPAFDDAFNSSGGIEVLAPEDLVVTRASSSNPGDAFYATGASKMRYWFGHLEFAPGVGKKFRKGQVMGKTLNHDVGGGPHVHVGLNIEHLVGAGRQLLHHTNYTHGAPKVGTQLAALL
jgi:hypothetical protein